VTQREETILKNVEEILIKRLDPGKIILFGSRARKKNDNNADFDLAIDKTRIDIRLHRKIKEEIDSVCGLYKIDIVFLSSVDRSFKELVLKTGKVIYERIS